MNAPLNVALLQLRATSAAAVVDQPQVAAGLDLLMTEYNHDGLYLDLYGVADEADGCSVEAVALTGTKVDVSGLLAYAQLASMARAVDRAGVQARAASREEGRAERAAWDRAAMA